MNIILRSKTSKHPPKREISTPKISMIIVNIMQCVYLLHLQLGDFSTKGEMKIAELV